VKILIAEDGLAAMRLFEHGGAYELIISDC
jgi:hypothetical protein